MPTKEIFSLSCPVHLIHSLLQEKCNTFSGEPYDPTQKGSDLTEANCTKGDRGPPGPPGPKGNKGVSGMNGEKGSNGTDGPRGEPGNDGVGQRGSKGEVGEQGQKGSSGPKGMVKLSCLTTANVIV